MNGDEPQNWDQQSEHSDHNSDLLVEKNRSFHLEMRVSPLHKVIGTKVRVIQIMRPNVFNVVNANQVLGMFAESPQQKLTYKVPSH